MTCALRLMGLASAAHQSWHSRRKIGHLPLVTDVVMSSVYMHIIAGIDCLGGIGHGECTSSAELSTSLLCIVN